MISSIDVKLRNLDNIQVSLENEADIRNIVSDIIVLAQKENRADASLHCYRKLRQLENEKCSKASSCEKKQLDVGRLLGNICLCADVVLADVGRNIMFDFPSEKISCCPDFIISAFLNLISNSAKFGKCAEISAYSKRKGDFTCVVVENRARVDFSAVKASLGLRAASNAARLHGGRLLFSTSDDRVRVGFSLSCFGKSEEKFEIPDFSDFLSNRFSPVHIGLSDVSVLPRHN